MQPSGYLRRANCTSACRNHYVLSTCRSIAGRKGHREPAARGIVKVAKAIAPCRSPASTDTRKGGPKSYWRQWARHNLENTAINQPSMEGATVNGLMKESFGLFGSG